MTARNDRFRPPAPKLERPELLLGELSGLRLSGVAAGIKPSGNPDVALLVGDAPMAVAGVFTQNAFAAAPVVVSREHLERTRGYAVAVVINSGNANACTGPTGERAARAMCRETARLVGCADEEVIVCSTGVIGQKLDVDRVIEGIGLAQRSLADGEEASRAFLAAIQTTDAFPKEAGRRLPGSAFGVAGVCKGAGMIEPNMATLLAFVATDAPASPEALRRAIGRVADRSFHAVHVDSHASTNDTFLMMSTRGNAKAGDIGYEGALSAVARRLAWLVARDGEGATKVTTLEVRGAPSDEIARIIARRVATSALVRTALFGADPNWGRFVSQVGNVPEAGDLSDLTCSVQGTVVFERGGPAKFDRSAVSERMRAEDVRIMFDLARGSGAAQVMTSDLGYRYVEVNAEYTT